jgi:phosphoribosylaminoimidazole-succinocarboxamide synthase
VYPVKPIFKNNNTQQWIQLLQLTYFPGQNHYRGKVREVYNINDELLVMVIDRQAGIWCGFAKRNSIQRAILNQIANKVHGTNCRYRSELVNCNPDPNVAVGHLCAL